MYLVFFIKTITVFTLTYYLLYIYVHTFRVPKRTANASFQIETFNVYTIYT